MKKIIHIPCLAAIIALLMIPMAMTKAQSLKVMTYNIRYDTPADSVNQWGKRTDRVYALIQKYDPDILGVQEAVHNQVTDLATHLNGYSYIGVGRDDGKTKGEYSALFYKKGKLSVVREGTFWLSPTPTVVGSKGWDAAITRVATWAVMNDKLTGKNFFVLNTHFDHMGKEARLQSANIIKKQAHDLAGALPVIVTGDLNCTREEPPYTALMNKEDLHLYDPAPSPAPGTFCTFKVNTIVCRPIDYILHTSEWKASGYQVITDNNGKYYPSDHLPVLVELTR